MTAAATLRLLAGAGMAAILAAAVHALRADSPPEAAKLAIGPRACSSCDARHARLYDLQAAPPEVNE